LNAQGRTWGIAMTIKHEASCSFDQVVHFREHLIEGLLALIIAA